MAKDDPLEVALGRKGALAGHAVREDVTRERYPRAINIAIDEETYRAIALYAAKHGIQKNETVRRILAEGLAEEIGELEKVCGEGIVEAGGFFSKLVEHRHEQA